MIVGSPLFSPGLAAPDARQHSTSGEVEITTSYSVRFADILQQREPAGARSAVSNAATPRQQDVAQPIGVLRGIDAKSEINWAPSLTKSPAHPMAGSTQTILGQDKSIASAARSDGTPDSVKGKPSEMSDDEVPPNYAIANGDVSSAKGAMLSSGKSADAPPHVTGRATDDVTTLNEIPGSNPAISFINGSLFGHSSALLGSVTASAGVPAVVQMAGPSSTKISAPGGSALAQPQAAYDQLSPETAPEQTGQTRAFSYVAEKISAVDAAQSDELLLQADGKSISADYAVAPERENVDAALSDMTRPGEAGAPPVSAGLGGISQVVLDEQEIAAAPAQASATARSASVSNSRDAQVAGLSPVHVVVAFEAEGALQIMARVSGATAAVEEQAEHGLLATAGRAGSAVGRLRLNGVDRIPSVRS